MLFVRQRDAFRTACRQKHGTAQSLVRAFQELRSVCSRRENDIAASSTFPFGRTFNFGNALPTSSAQVIAALGPLTQDERMQKIRAVAAMRTFDVVPVVQGLSDIGNLSAILRSADALGYGGMHVIDMLADRPRPTSRSSKGSEKWVDVQTWTNTADCVAALRAQGRQVLVTHFDKSAIPIAHVDWTKPTAVILGNEVDGVSAEAIRLADASCCIPMSGFVQSLNVSVAAAIILHEARESRIRQQGYHHTLTPEEQDLLVAVLLLRGTRNGIEYMRTLVADKSQRSIMKHQALHSPDGAHEDDTS